MLVTQIRFVLLLSRQGKVRLAKWYTTYPQKERAKVTKLPIILALLVLLLLKYTLHMFVSLQIIRDISPLVLGRALKLCNFLDYQDIKVSGSVKLCLPGRELVCDVQPSRCVATISDSTQFAPAQVVYKRYASLYFVVGIDPSDNELITLEIIHHYVEVLDRYFGNVCELDLIFNFHKVSQILRGLLLVPTILRLVSWLTGNAILLL